MSARVGLIGECGVDACALRRGAHIGQHRSVLDEQRRVLRLNGRTALIARASTSLAGTPPVAALTAAARVHARRTGRARRAAASQHSTAPRRRVAACGGGEEADAAYEGGAGARVP
eukprot:375408-Prymnesium_polylepis.1